MRYYKTYYIVIILLIAFNACKEENRTEIFINKLQGDWISKSNKYDFLSVKDSLILIPFYGYDTEYQPYDIRNDSLIISKYNLSFYLSSISTKYIWTKDNEGGQAYPLFVNTNMFYNDNLSIKSLEVRFINKYNQGLVDWSIYFDEELNCYMYVDSIFIARSTKNPLLYSKGIYSIKLSESEFQYYDDKFKNLPLSEIKNEYVSDNYYPGITCFGNDQTALFFKCEYSVKNINKINHLEFIIKGTRRTPNILSVFIIPLFKMCNNLEFTRAEKFRYFELYDFKYSDMLN